MRRTQKYAQRLRLAKPATEYLRGHSERRPQTGERERAESPLSAAGILRLQHSIGNQAVQRLIIQRQPGKGGGGAKEPQMMPVIVATITFERAGKLEGSSRVAGHEGKVEFSSLSFTSRRPGARPGERENREAEPAKQIELAFTKPQDKTTVELQKASIDGDRIVTATFEFLRRDDNGDIVVAHTVEFSNGYITSLHLGGGGGETPVDAGTIEFVEKSE